MTTRRQHYVWRQYLEAWGTKVGRGYQLQCLRKGAPAPIPTETKNVAVEKDFYRLSEFEPGDADFVRAMVLHPDTNPLVWARNEAAIAQFSDLLQVVAMARSIPAVALEKQRLIEKMLIETPELSHARLESQCMPYMNGLRAGDRGFFDEERHAALFSNFLAHQYFRTKAVRDRTRTGLPQSVFPVFDRTWPLLRLIYASNVAVSIFLNRRTEPLRVIHAPPGAAFITSDQPLLNTYAAGLSYDQLVDQLELFYPVSPQVAMLIGAQRDPTHVHGCMLSAPQVEALNLAIQHAAHEQLFARDRAGLTGRRVGNS